MKELERRLAEPVPAEIDTERVAAELAARAQAAGLLDVAYASFDSPLGTLLVAVTPRGLVRISYEGEDAETVLADLAQRVSPRVLHAPERTDAVRRELDEYFAGSRHAFRPRSTGRWCAASPRACCGRRRVCPSARSPAMAASREAAGSPRASRAAGNALGSNPIPIVVPCHRVLHADGGLGGYSGGLERKRYLLELEGSLPD